MESSVEKIDQPGFENKVKSAWGNPKKVAEIAFSELFNRDDIGLDYDDQVRYALEIGVLAGSVSDSETFISRFEQEIIG